MDQMPGGGASPMPGGGGPPSPPGAPGGPGGAGISPNPALMLAELLRKGKAKHRRAGKSKTKGKKK